MIKLVIFDLDGTLVDSAHDIFEAANKTLAHYKLGPIDLATTQKHIGEGFGPFIRFVAGDRATDKQFCDEIFQTFQTYYDKQLLKHTGFYAGAEKFLGDYLSRHGKDQGQKLGIVSNKPEYQVRIILDGLGVKEKDLVGIFGGDTFEVKKPHPKPLEIMMERAGVKPDETVMVGDSKADVEAAKAAGTHFVAVTFGYNSRENLKAFGAREFIVHYDELMTKLAVFSDLKKL